MLPVAGMIGPRERRRAVRWSGLRLLPPLSLALLACGNGVERSETAAPAALPAEVRGSSSRDAKHETAAMLKDDLGMERDPSDGDGRAWLIEPRSLDGRPARVPAGSAQRFSIVFETGRHGIAVGGAVFRLRPELVEQVGADGTARTAPEAPALFESLWQRAGEMEGARDE